MYPREYIPGGIVWLRQNVVVFWPHKGFKLHQRWGNLFNFKTFFLPIVIWQNIQLGKMFIVC